MRQILGKTLFLILFLTINSVAGVKATLSSVAIYRGDMVNLTITASGEDIKFPQISEIEGYPVLGTSSSQSIQIINGVTTKSISKSYTFKPTKNITIEPFQVEVDGSKVKTEPLELKVVKPTASKNGSPFVLEMSLDKNSSHVGEPIDLAITFKQKLNAHADKIQLGEPKLENFWVKKVDKVKQGSEGEYATQTIHYKLFAQKAGSYTIPPLEALVGRISHQRGIGGGFFDDPFFNSMTQQLDWKKIYSNELKLEVEPLPNGLEVFGNYQIDSSVDKKKVYANKPVNLTISIKGEGNIDDIKKFELNIPNAIVYADEPQIESSLIHNIYQGVFKQKIAIIADANFTIPAIEFSFFDKATQKVKIVKTNPIEIEVIGGQEGVTKPSTIEVSPKTEVTTLTNPQPKSSIKVVTKEEPTYIKYLFLALGFILGIATMFGVEKVQHRVKPQQSNMVKAIKKAKNDKALFELLLPYAKESSVISNTLNKLEENIYKSASNKIDRELLMEFFEERL